MAQLARSYTVHTHAHMDGHTENIIPLAVHRMGGHWPRNKNFGFKTAYKVNTVESIIKYQPHIIRHSAMITSVQKKIKT